MSSPPQLDEFEGPSLGELSREQRVPLTPPSNLSSIAEELNGDKIEEVVVQISDSEGAGRKSRILARHSSISNNSGHPLDNRGSFRKTSSPYISIDDAGEVFGIVQLNVYKVKPFGLDVAVERREWREIARWIKYEQDLEEGAERLGRPHIAPLAFHFLMRLHILIEKNAIALLDLAEKDMGGIGSRITEVLGAAGVIQPNELNALMDDLLLKHKLAPDREKGGFVSKLSGWEEPQPTSPPSGDRRPAPNVRNIILKKMAFANRSISFSFQPRRGSDIDAGSEESSRDAFLSAEARRRRTSSLQLVLQASAESSIILIRGEFKRRRGELVFVRLAEATPLSDVSMIPTPTRIIVLILAPAGLEEDYIEIGKSLGTLLANRRFYETGLAATSTNDLLCGINEFLQESIVLPPGEWYTNERLHDLLPQHELENKSNLIKRQKHKGAQQSTDSADGPAPRGEGTVEPKTKPAGKEIPGPFVRTGKPFGGMLNDMRRRYPGYKDDFRDGFNVKCLAATIFLYFASIAHNVTFGGLLAQKTNGYIGIQETLVGATCSGILFAFFSGQPILPIAPTAPLLLFDEILYKFMGDYGFEFLPARAWIGLWVFIISIIYVMLEGSVVVKNFTRFTQETFAALISVVFIVESVTALINIYHTHPLIPQLPNETSVPIDFGDIGDSLGEEEGIEEVTTTASPIHKPGNEPNTALLSTFLMFGTFLIGFTLKKMRGTQLFPTRVRNTLSDFSVPIAIFLMVGVDKSTGGVFTDKIQVPKGFAPTSPDKRGWLIPMWGMEKPFDPWIPLVTLLPGTLVFILMSMTLQICELILSERDKLDKGNGFHLDVLIAGFINFGSGLFGLPWLSCATLKALAHCSALTVYATNTPPGSPPTVLYIIQERLTSLVMSLLIGFSILAAPLLNHVSMSILFGVFLYMGITSLIATQFYERILLFITPSHDHPPVVYVRKVPTWKIHLFTLVQIGCIGLLWVVRSIKAIALTFPFIIMLLVPIRISLKHIFTESELEALDGKPKLAEKPPEKTPQA